MANSEKMRRRKELGGKAHDPEAITYGRPAPGMPQGPNNQDMNPGNFRSMAPSMASMSGKTQNPFMDAEAFVPQMGAPGGSNIATFSGQNENIVPGQGHNRVPGQYLPSFNQAGSSPDADMQEGMRLNEKIMASGLYGGPMGLANPGMMPAPASVPGQMTQQTATTLPAQGITGGLAQGGEDQQKKPARGGRNSKGMTT